MASFASVASAVQSAIDIQRAFDAHNKEHPEPPLRVCIGATAGEPVQEERDLFGASVQLAARLCGKAQPGQILVSTVVRDLCLGKRFQFEDRGAAELKGFDFPVSLVEVRWQG
jgi:adenylate cyclase